MKPERLAEIRKVATFGNMRTNTERTTIRRALVELLDYVDGLASEYTADPPLPDPEAVQHVADEIVDRAEDKAKPKGRPPVC